MKVLIKSLIFLFIGLFIFTLFVSAGINYRINGQNVFSVDQDVNILGTVYGGSPVKIGGGLNITTGHVYIAAGDLHLDGNLLHDIGNVSFSGGYFNVDSNNINLSETLINDRLTVRGSESVGGYNATIEIENTATGGDRWFLRAGAIGTPTPVGGFSIADTSAYRFAIDEDGRVGIGTTSPDRMLHIAKGSNVGIHLEDTGTGGNFSLIAWGVSNTFSIYDDTNSKHRLVILDSGFVGIGTQTPGLPLEVRSADDNQIFVFDSRTQAQGVGGGIAFGGKYNDAGGEALAGRIGTQKTNGISGNVSFDMIFETQDWEGVITERMILTGDGKVGIGEESPTEALHVLGDVRVSGLEGSYTNAEAYLCVTDGGVIFAKDSTCS